jgi:hypothetical protein
LAEIWENWQVELLDDFILGYSPYETQEELSDYIGKSLNAVKIKLGRRKDEIQIIERQLNIEEYKIVLANRFDKNTEEVAEIINSSKSFLLHELDEIDCLECSEYLEEGYKERDITNDEYILVKRLYTIKRRNAFQISQIMNRPIGFIKELIKPYAI